MYVLPFADEREREIDIRVAYCEYLYSLYSRSHGWKKWKDIKEITVI